MERLQVTDSFKTQNRTNRTIYAVRVKKVNAQTIKSLYIDYTWFRNEKSWSNEKDTVNRDFLNNQPSWMLCSLNRIISNLFTPGLLRILLKTAVRSNARANSSNGAEF